MTSLYETIVRGLRGRHNSVRHKFLVLPRAWLGYMASRASGRSWQEHYRGMVDRSAMSTDLDAPVVTQSIEDGAKWLPFFEKHGVKSNTRFLDLGCGRCRMGVYLIPMLTEGRYVGADISQETMKNGVKILSRSGIGPERYDLFWIKDNTLDVLKGQSFDFGMMWSVITHLEIQEVAKLFRELRPLMRPGSKFLFTFTARDQLDRMNLKDFSQPIPVIEKILRDAGFEFSMDPDWWGGYEEDKLGIASVPR